MKFKLARMISISLSLSLPQYRSIALPVSKKGKISKPIFNKTIRPHNLSRNSVLIKSCISSYMPNMEKSYIKVKFLALLD